MKDFKKIAAPAAGKSLIEAAQENDTLSAQDALRKSPDKINACDETGMTALMWAARMNAKHIAEHLVEKGANVNCEDENGYTALDWAIVNGSTSVFKFLRAHNAKNGSHTKNKTGRYNNKNSPPPPKNNVQKLRAMARKLKPPHSPK